MASKSKNEDPVFLIEFIKLIEKYPCIWNYKLKDYSKMDITGLAWKRIAAELTDTEQNCRDRWRNIRCAFVRAQKLPRSRSGRKSKKPYYLAQHLSFLLPYTKGNFNLGNLRDKPNEDHSNDEDEEEHDLNESELNVKENAMRQEEPQCADSALPLIEKKCFKRSLTSQRQTQPDADAAFVEWEQFKKKKDEEEDSDWFFLRSLLPDIKKLDNQRKRNFKSRMMSYLNELLDE